MKTKRSVENIAPGLKIVERAVSLPRLRGFVAGDIVRTLGYRRAMDGGGNEFVHHGVGRPEPAFLDDGFYWGGSGADDWFEATDQSVVNVRQFGATGDGKTDDTQALQKAVESWKRKSGRLHFPRGKYNISQTLNLGGSKVVGNLVTSDGPNSDNFHFQSDRFAPRAETSVGHGGASLVWVGRSPAPMITYDSSDLVWDGPALWGKYTSAKNARASTGFEVTKGSGIGSGRIHFRQLIAGDVDIALHANGKTNVDQFQVDRFQVRDAEVGFRSESSQNTGNFFGYVAAHTITTAVFDFAVMAHTVVGNFVANNKVNCLVRSANASNSSGQFICQSMKVDPASSNMVLVDTSASYNSHARFVFSSITGSPPLRMNLRGESVVVIRDSQHVASFDQLVMQATEGYGIIVEFQNCFIPLAHDTQNIVHSTSEHTWVIFRDCYGESGKPRPSEASVAGGPPGDFSGNR